MRRGNWGAQGGNPLALSRYQILLVGDWQLGNSVFIGYVLGIPKFTDGVRS